MSFLARLYPLLLVVAVWEAAARAGLVRPIFLPPFTDVLATALPLAADGKILWPLATSIWRALAGMALATVGGVAIGLAMARSKLALIAADPLVSVGFPAPKIAFVPVFILWFGIGDLSKILLVAFTCIFPMVVATYHGATAVNRNFLWSARAMGTNDNRVMWKVVVPAAMPYIFSGLRVTLPVALITAFTAEMVAGGGGVGGELMFAQRFIETPSVFVYILVMLATGVALDWLMLALRRRVLAWHAETAFE